jgi:hypothetical protein
MKRFLAATIVIAAAAAWPALATAQAGGWEAGFEEPMLVAQQADCSAAAAQAAAETGGQVLSVSSRGNGPDAECVVTVLVPGQDGDRPRKQTITVRP